MNIFILEDDEERMKFFRAQLKDSVIDHAESCEDRNDFRPPYDCVFLDHDLGGRQLDEHEDNGFNFVRKIKWKVGRTYPIVIHSHNPLGALSMERFLEPFGPVVRQPFMGKSFLATIEAIKNLSEPITKIDLTQGWPD